MKFNDRTNEVRINNQGLKMKIIKYNKYSDIDVEFEDGYVAKNKNYSIFKRDEIINPYFRSVFGIGYIGDGKYKPTKNGIINKNYSVWNHMIGRCYNKNNYTNNPTYKDCTVCEEWQCFQNFAEWFDENYYEISNEKIQLDKDILIKGNKIYSPDTCCFVPEKINKLFTNRQNKRGDFPIGVYYSEKENKFQSQFNKNNETIHLGRYNNPIKAFNIYKTEKEKYIKEVADEYKNKIPQKLYDAMYKYEVEIND